ncbi:uncharacterized protein TRAVEDRAFT_73880 [Trametes versicolor FP-101664 SS1]|uniref:uncharacterized protein n=1 Tax=Trametes versicolor (strain FP-101664) TaxID=717944 RepID=UPI0004623097|nr:uncharacterized protein TRAVEDRAFT_73880 [Trametes versicolor FP-101664 SS1]EIW54759.1 hypothetical protein TRAVEDRAFT_73880 [Trametes versicolor FP-101664 SS1]
MLLTYATSTSGCYGRCVRRRKIELRRSANRRTLVGAHSPVSSTVIPSTERLHAASRIDIQEFEWLAQLQHAPPFSRTPTRSTVTRHGRIAPLWAGPRLSFRLQLGTYGQAQRRARRIRMERKADDRPLPSPAGHRCILDPAQRHGHRPRRQVFEALAVRILRRGCARNELPERLLATPHPAPAHDIRPLHLRRRPAARPQGPHRDPGDAAARRRTLGALI